MRWQTRQLAVIAWSATIAASSGLHAQQNGNATDFQFQSNGLCLKCHSATLSQADIAKGIGNRVCLTESTFWEKADLHSDAHKSLSSDRGKRIVKLLGAESAELESTGCVQCHTSSVAAPVLFAEGVSCEGCHGPSSKWLGEHVNAEWQTRSVEGKADSGFYDVRSPISRAELCISCHVGSVEENRVITHAMYAAGHPPLPGFELESFADEMPRHWRYPFEKTSTTKGSLVRTRNLLVAAVVSMRMAIDLTVADADASNQRWPEYARLDCYACHHDLKLPSWRQDRSASGIPGRPPLVSGCVPLVSVAAAIGGGEKAEDEFANTMDSLRSAFDSNPFGDPKELVTQGNAAIAWCRSLEQQLASKQLTPKIAIEALHQLTDQATAYRGDYDTTRQLLGAWFVIGRELNEYDALNWSDDTKKRLAAELKSLEQEYPGLVLRGATRVACNDAPPAKREYDQLLSQNTANRIDFDPQRFRDIVTIFETAAVD